MRVLQVINAYGHGRGGAELLALNLHAELLSEGVDAHLIGLETSAAPDTRGTASLGYESPYRPSVIARLAAEIAPLKPGLDVVHAHLFPAGAYVAALKTSGFLRVPAVYTEHSTWNKRRQSRGGRTVDRMIYGGFDKIAAISQGTKSALIDSYPQLEGKTAVVENGIRPFFNAPIERTPGRGIRILSLGRLVRPKNIDTALKALAQLTDISFMYTIVGDGDDRADLEDLTKELGLSDRVVFVGNTPKTRPYLEDADVFLMPSRWEGFGLAAAEAMNASLPIIASNVPGLAEVVGPDGDCGYLVDPEDTDGLAAVLRDVMCDRDRRVALGRRAFERSQRFTIDKMTNQYLSIYQDMTEVR